MTPSRLLLGVAGVAVLLEVGLRLSGPLPSLRAQPRPFEAAAYPSVKAIGPEPRGCIETDTGQPPPTAWRWMAGEGTDAPLRMLVVGDSVALGRGVNPRDTWAVGLAQRLASVHDRRVEVVNAAVNASGYCGAFRTIHHQAAHTIDWVVVGLFADDLEQWLSSLMTMPCTPTRRPFPGWSGCWLHRATPSTPSGCRSCERRRSRR